MPMPLAAMSYRRSRSEEHHTTSISHKCFLRVKSAHIAYFGDSLRPQRWTNTEHFQDIEIFRQLCCKHLHFLFYRDKCSRGFFNLRYYLLNEQLGCIRFWHDTNAFADFRINIVCSFLLEIVSVLSAPLLAFVRKHRLIALRNAVAMPGFRHDLLPSAQAGLLNKQFAFGKDISSREIRLFFKSVCTLEYCLY